MCTKSQKDDNISKFRPSNAHIFAKKAPSLACIFTKMSSSEELVTLGVQRALHHSLAIGANITLQKAKLAFSILVLLQMVGPGERFQAWRVTHKNLAARYGTTSSIYSQVT